MRIPRAEHALCAVAPNTAATVKLPRFGKITVNGKPTDENQFDLRAGKWESS